MKKHILLIFSLLALAFNVKAQSAETVFKNAVAKLQEYDNIEIEFDYSMINTEAGIFETMEGNGFIKGEAYKLRIMGQEIICDGDTKWVYNADAEEVMISTVDKSEGSGTPLSIIESYNDNITARFMNETDGNIRIIEVKTLIKDDNIIKLLVLLDTQSLEIKDIHAFDRDKNEFVYEIKKFVTNQKLPADFFTFKESDYPNAEIIDMR